MIVFWVIKFVVVIFFVLMYFRTTKLAWGIGLLTVTSAILLDTFLSVFSRDEMMAEMGFFFYIIAGGLFGGAALWVWGVLRPVVAGATMAEAAAFSQKSHAPTASFAASESTGTGTAFDRQMLYDEIHNRFGREDMLDLIFDLGINENDVMTLNQDMNQLIIRTMDLAEQQGQTGTLAIAVERILTPLPPENLPRLEKITVDSPPTVLRQYLLAHYTLSQLEQLAIQLGIDWEQVSQGSKKGSVRTLLLYLSRRNRLDELIELVKASAGITGSEEEE